MKNKTQIQLIACITLLSPLFSPGQNAHIPADKKMQMHHETLGDPYLPNAYNNKKTSPAYKHKVSGASKVMTGSTCFTTQVNVDASGQNILGDAANEPNIAVNPVNKNEMVIGWRQFDNVTSNFRQAGWSYTSDSGQSWTFPGVIEPGVFRSDPVLDFDANGNFYYNSLTNTPNYFCKVFKSINGGVAWDNGTDAAGGDKQWMAIDRTTGVGSGNIYSFWSSFNSSCPPGFFTRSTNGNSSYENCTEVDGYPALGTMAVGIAGELFIAGIGGLDSISVAKSLNAQIPASLISWNLPVSVFMDGNISSSSINPQGLQGQVNIDVDISSGLGQDNVYVLASMARSSSFDPCDVMFARSTDGGLTWSTPIQINDDGSQFNTQWFGTMSVAPDGRIDAVWLDTRDDLFGLDSSALYYSYSHDEGNTWSVNEKLSDNFDPHTGYPMQQKMGDYFDMISDSTGAHLAWANTLNGEQDVYYSHIIPPVNTAVNEISNNATISIYPNPTGGLFVIKGLARQSQIEIYNVMGEKIYSTTIFKTKSEIDISPQPAGIYFLKIVNQNGSTVVKKIIKE
ncbi:MAG: T9SS type A sorting domain-containing protein [Bacteroidia bacterium]